MTEGRAATHDCMRTAGGSEGAPACSVRGAGGGQQWITHPTPASDVDAAPGQQGQPLVTCTVAVAARAHGVHGDAANWLADMGGWRRAPSPTPPDPTGHSLSSTDCQSVHSLLCSPGSAMWVFVYHRDGLKHWEWHAGWQAGWHLEPGGPPSHLQGSPRVCLQGLV